jgi:hypothetical protein
MIFVSVQRSAQLDFTTPLKSCCNCGGIRNITLVETPLRRTRYMVFGGTELTIEETFPYCPACRRSATRVRPGLLARLLTWVLASVAVATVVMMRMSINVEAFVPVVRDHPICASMAIAAVGCLAWFVSRDRRPGGRSWWQPVRLVGIDLAGDTLRHVTLAFTNAQYAAIFAASNGERVRAGMLTVRAD